MRKSKDPAYPKTRLTLGDHLRAARLDRGLLQREVAAQLWVSRISVRGWEHGEKFPQVRYLPKVIEFLRYCLWEPARHQGDLLRRTRRALGLSHRRFGALAGADPATVSRWETQGRRLPSVLVRWLQDPTVPIPRAGRIGLPRSRDHGRRGGRRDSG